MNQSIWHCFGIPVVIPFIYNKNPKGLEQHVFSACFKNINLLRDAAYHFFAYCETLVSSMLLQLLQACAVLHQEAVCGHQNTSKHTK